MDSGLSSPREGGNLREMARGWYLQGTASRRRVALVAVVALVAAFAADASRPPAFQRTARTAIRMVHLYQRTVAPALDRLGMRCRFTPTCSHYSEAVLREHGIVDGTWRAAWRIVRCGPWTPAGTVDVPR